MRVQLVKREDRWDLYDNTGHKIGSTLDGCSYKISLKNCEAIELGYDLDELAYDYSWNHQSDPKWGGTIDIFKDGFQKALSILGDKKFSEEQLREAFFHVQNEPTFDVFKQSLQQTEWDVRIDVLLTERHGGVVYETPKLDADGFLILKKKENG